MAFPPRIRKDILAALDEHIIPPLWQRQVSLGYVAPPLRFPAGIEKHLLSRRLPRPDKLSPGFPILKIWTKAKLHSTSHAYLSFIYRGMAEERTLITAAQVAGYRMEKGVYGVRCQAPGALFFSANTPRNSGSADFSYIDSRLHLPVNILQIAFRDEILVHIHKRVSQQVETTHSLLVKDIHLLNLAVAFEEGLRNAPVSNQDTAQAMLLAFLLRLRHYLFSHAPRLANTAHPPSPDFQSAEGRGQEIYREIIYFIQTHLHEKISLLLLTRKFPISSTHLNRLFHQFNGIPVMRYVRRQRIEAAKTMLPVNHDESIKEIATLLQFKSTSAFCSAFRQETGLTPKQFRRQTG
jgi:AraC-like DNA-binding protein